MTTDPDRPVMEAMDPERIITHKPCPACGECDGCTAERERLLKRLISDLTAENERLREALERIAGYSLPIEPHMKQWGVAYDSGRREAARIAQDALDALYR